MKAKSQSFSELNLELEAIMATLEASTDIDEALKYYQRGTEIIKELQEYLNNAENQVKKIKNATGKN